MSTRCTEGGQIQDSLDNEPDWSFLCTLATDPPGQLDVLGHDGDALGVDGAQVGVLEQTGQVGLASLLKKSESETMEQVIP